MAQMKPPTCPPSARCLEIEEAISPRLFKALSDPRRLTLLVELCRCAGPSTVTEISQCCPTDLSVVSRHLATLRDAGVLESTKSGREVHYTVRYHALATALRRIADSIEACCPPPVAAEETVGD